MPFLNCMKSDFVPGADSIKLERPLTFYCEQLRDTFTAPKGFESDGASVPRFLWPLLGHPLQKKIRKAAVLHDYLYRYRDDLSRNECDLIFYEALRAEEVSYIKAKAYYLGVRVGGGFCRKITKTLYQT